jgi:hypothetical protein
MSIDKEALSALATQYTSTMTSIRGRRVHRLLMREFSRFDVVVPAVVGDGSAAMLALSEKGNTALCQSDGRGKTVSIVECAGAKDATTTTSYDLLKDSLPTVGSTVQKEGLRQITGTLSVAGAGLSRADRKLIRGDRSGVTIS